MLNVKTKSLNKNQIAKNSGFSLLEVLVAIFIVLVGFVGVMILIDKAIVAGSQSASKLIAANLAQEGIEVVKNIRELNYDQTVGWDNWYSSFTQGTAYPYMVEYDDQNLTRPDNGLFLRFNSSTGLYSYNAGAGNVLTTFKRTVTLTRISAAEMKVVSVVSWTDHGQSPTPLTVEDRLWNWR